VRVREEARPSSVPGLRVDATVAQAVQSAERTACDDNAGRVDEFRARAQARVVKVACAVAAGDRLIRRRDRQWFKCKSAPSRGNGRSMCDGPELAMA
jgi:hypothetical protein